MKRKYCIKEFRDENGNILYRIFYKYWFTLWVVCKEILPPDGLTSTPKEFKTLDEADKELREIKKVEKEKKLKEVKTFIR